MMIRTAAERLSRGIVVKRRLPQDFASRRLYVSPDAALRFWNPASHDYDPVLLGFVRNFVRPTDVVLDAGANVGIFTFAAAQSAGPSGHVIAVDADEWLVALLRRSAGLKAHGEADVTVISAAIAGEQGMASFSIAARGRASNHLTATGGSSEAGGTRETRVVVTTTLDVIAANTRRPTVLKIDLEGAEVGALSGAADILARDRPVVLCEVDAKNSKPVGDLFAQHGYALFDADTGSGNFRAVDSPSFNTIGCPRERVSQFPPLRA